MVIDLTKGFPSIVDLRPAQQDPNDKPGNFLVRAEARLDVIDPEKAKILPSSAEKIAA